MAGVPALCTALCVTTPTLKLGALLMQQLCCDTCVGNVVALAGMNLNHKKFYRNCARISIELCRSWSVLTLSVELCCLAVCCRMHCGIKGGDVRHQVKIKKSKVCHWLNKLLNELLCTFPSHSLWISPGTPRILGTM